jgi:hypothetical protein
MHRIGPWAFDDADLHSTLADGWALFDELELGLGPDGLAAVAPHRTTAGNALEGVLDGTREPEEALEVLWASWRAAMAALRPLGAYGPGRAGSVTACWVSDGGVPKTGVDRVVITAAGVEGDRQKDRRHHGRPFQAVCLWSSEVIERFRGDGHPLAPGLAGENLTLSGLDWAAVRPGAHLRVGDSVLEVSSHAVPCKKNRDWFLDGRFDLMHHKHGPVSRMYATVLEPGTVRPGDAAILEPEAS